MPGKEAIAINWSRSAIRAALAGGSAVILIIAFMHGSAARSAETGDEDLLREVLAAAAGHDQAGWAYTRTVQVRAGAGGEREVVYVTEKFDPSKPPGEQRERMQVREDEDGVVTTEYNDDMDIDVDRVVYADLAELEFEHAELLSDSEEEAVYKIEIGEGEEFGFGGARFEGGTMMDDVYGELVIRKTGPAAPYVSEVRVRNTDTSGSLLADIEKLEISYRFSPSPDGSTYLSQGLNLEIELEVLIFIDIEVDIETEYSDYVYVGEYGS